MRKYLPGTALLLLLFSAACKRDAKPPEETPDWSAVTIQLTCTQLEGSDDAPLYAVYLQVGDRKTKIAEIHSTCDAITQEEFSAYEIPETAFAAVGGWWAGAGDYFYVIPENGKVLVFQGSADEMQEAPGYNYQAIATYDGKKFSVTLPTYKSDLVGLYALDGAEKSWVLFVGLHEDTLQGQFFEADGHLPPAEQLVHFLPTLQPVPLPDIALNTTDLSFQSAIGKGRFERTDNSFQVQFDDKKDAAGKPVVLTKIVR
ncbi:MAG: hypothetical protein KF852_05875 [Saprospiraceae bacterium]|nr:hypothetical protein [Saprospiraceae bacterium]